MKSLFFLCLGLCVAAIAAEYCGHKTDCINERCPHGTELICENNVCTCGHAGECSASSDCQNIHGKCGNNDKHWYCNGGKCCCGEPCPHAGDQFICNRPQDCEDQFYRCTNNDKHWYCVNQHCHCGSRHGDIGH